MTTKLFSELGLSAEVLKAIDKLGYEQASPIQAEAIPLLLQGHDLVGQSQTGSGKTAAFSVPAIEKVQPQVRAVQILILCPTRELAIQVSEEVHKLALFKRGVNALPIYGGQSYDRQLMGLKQGAQIVIGTPGRVMDHMRRGTLRLDQVKMIILDEADVMLDMGFREDIEFVLEALPETRQTVFFSATLPRPIQDLIQRFAKDPKSVRIQQTAMTVPTVEQHYYEVDRRFKVELLTRLIDIHDLKLGIIFCNTKQMVDDLTEHLNAQGYSADRLHGGMSQAMRDRVMTRFRRSNLEFLVATDVAARGIDVDDVEVVFNYDLPYDGEDYVHRIGRTGRAGRSGQAITFVSGREVFLLQQIERFTRMRIQRGKIPTATEVEEARANATLIRLRSVLEKGEYKQQEQLLGRLMEEGYSSTDIASALLHELQGGSESAGRREAPAKPAPGREAPARDRVEPQAPRPPLPAERTPAERPTIDRPAADPAPSSRTPVSRKPIERPAENLPGKSGVVSTENPDQTETVRAERTERAERPTARRADVQKARATEEVPPRLPSSASPARISVAQTPIAPRSPVHPPEGEEPAKPRTIARTPPTTSAETPAPVPPIPPVLSKVDSIPKEASPTAIPAATSSGAKESTAPRRPSPSAAPKVSRAPAADQSRLYMNIGETMGITSDDIIAAILGSTGLPAATVGRVDLRERHLFVDVAAEHAQRIISQLNRATLKEHKLKVKMA